MTPEVFNAFEDEMEKIARFRAAGKFARGVFENVKRTVKGFKTPIQSMKEGWHYDGAPSNKWWKGKKPGGAWTGEGKVTSKLPIGPKSLTVAGGVVTLPEAVSEKDPSGQGRSRTHRMARWAGSQAGGLIGAPHGFSGAMVGGLIGEGAGAASGSVYDSLKRKRPTAIPKNVEGKQPR